MEPVLSDISDTANYLAAIRRNPRTATQWPDAFPATHSAALSLEIAHELSKPTPALLSKATRSSHATQQSHKPDEDKQHVFCYLGPRIKPSPGKPGTTTAKIIFLFAIHKREKFPGSVAIQCARPFDSGGLAHDAGIKARWSAEQLQRTIQNLTFRTAWQNHFEEWVEHMFTGLDAYMSGEQATGTEPLALDRQDRWNFTWELLTLNELPFSNKLVAIMDVRPPGSKSTLNETALAIVKQKASTKRIQYLIIDQKNVNEEILHNLFLSANNFPGW